MKRTNQTKHPTMLRSAPLLLLCVFFAWCDRGHAFAVAPRAPHVVSNKPHLAPSASLPPQTSTALFLGPELLAVPSLSSVALASLIPSLLGYYKTEYGVSYAYGGAIATTAWMVLGGISANSLAGVHALALLAYGIRLNLFLLYREVNIPYFTEVRERIEEKSQKKGSRISRTPFVLGVAFLYACMSAPMFVTASSTAMAAPFFSLSGGLRMNVSRFLVGTTWMGFLLGAFGDATKTIVKSKKGAGHLVTEGVYRFFRHPNYTGEFIGWTASALAAVLISGVSWLSVASIVGALGIDFVLVQAATGLERKQREKYGESESYQKWIQGSWAGVTKKLLIEEEKTE